MSVQFHSPAGLIEQSVYHPVAVGTGTIVCMAGQVGVESDGQTVAPDFVGQILAALRGVVTGVASAGAGPADLLRLTMYVVDWNAEKLDRLREAIATAQQELGLPTPLPPLTVIGVQALYRPELMVEIEAMAAVG